MKLPRWLVVCMLSISALSVLGAAGWWWVTWPERTARRFVDSIVAQRVDAANKMMRPEAAVRTSDSYAVRFDDDWKDAKLERTNSLSWRNLILSRQDFKVDVLTFTIERGKVVDPVVIIVVLPDGQELRFEADTNVGFSDNSN